MITEVYKVQKMIPMVRHFPQTPSMVSLTLSLMRKNIFFIFFHFLCIFPLTNTINMAML